MKPIIQEIDTDAHKVFNFRFACMSPDGKEELDCVADFEYEWDPFCQVYILSELLELKALNDAGEWVQIAPHDGLVNRLRDLIVNDETIRQEHRNGKREISDSGNRYFWTS